MLSFMRFATCPFCNLRIHQLVQRSGELPDDFTIVAVFDSEIDHLRKSSERHNSPFPILADKNGSVHRLYGIEHSIAGVMKGMFFRLPLLMKAMFVHGYWPFPIKGSMTTMPADFLIDAQGIIRTAYYGTDEGDHLPIEELIAFSSHK